VRDARAWEGLPPLPGPLRLEALAGDLDRHDDERDQAEQASDAEDRNDGQEQNCFIHHWVTPLRLR